MKWYWITSRTPGTQVPLLHSVQGGNLVLLDRYRDCPRCRRCGKFDERQLLEDGFALDRTLPVFQDSVTPDDAPFVIVSERFVDLLSANAIAGVEFQPCGFARSGQRLFLMLPVHRSACRAPISAWCRKRPYPADEDECCSGCGRVVHTVGHPYAPQLTLPDSGTISVPDVPTEMRTGRDYRFLCSQEVRTHIKRSPLTGICFTDLREAEKWWPMDPDETSN